MRRCLASPPDVVWEAAAALQKAVAFHARGDRAAAAALFRQANSPLIRVWFQKVVGPYDPAIHGVRPTTWDPPHLPRAERPRPRMPSAAVKHHIRARDGYHCRFCTMPVIARAVFVAIAAAYPQDAPWSDVAANQHSFFQAANLQYDHILPHARGGGSTLENMVVTCAVCNYGRMSFTLRESQLLDPRDYAPYRFEWDGLVAFTAA
jgi:HNH endonuclease